MRLTLVIICTGLSLILKAERRVDSVIVDSFARQAIGFRSSDDHVKAILYIKKAIHMAENAGLDGDYIHNKLYNFLANRYSNIGDFDRAIEIGNKLEIYYRRTNNVAKELFNKNNLAIFYRNKKSFAIAYQYCKDVWQKRRMLTDTADQLDLLDGLAASSINLGNLNEANYYLSQAENLLLHYEAPWKNELKLYWLVNKANYALARADTLRAERSLLECINLNQKLKLRKGADAYNEIARIYINQGRFDKVIEQKSAIEKLLDVNKNPYLKDPYLLKTYMLAAQASYKLNDFANALYYVEKAEGQAAFHHSKYMFDESKFFLNDIRRENLELGVQVCYNLYEVTANRQYAQTALTFAEKAKSNVLSERINTARRLNTSEISDDVKSLRFELLYELNMLEKKGGATEAMKVRDRLDSINTSLGLALAEIQVDNNVKALQNRISDKELVLFYFVTDLSLYTFQITNESVELFRLMITPNIFLNLYISTKEKKAYNVKPIANLLPDLKVLSHFNKVTIVPDGELYYIPFELLYTEPEYRNIVFSYDFSLQSILNTKGYTNKVRYVGFAPDFSDSENLAYLKNGKNSVVHAQEFFGGNTYLGSEASGQNMIEHGLDADILHLYTHGISSDSSYNSSFVYFDDRKMYVDEILALPLQNNLCLLTACEVGLGKKFSGEGVTGIAWAFKGAGAGSIVQSLWKLNERSSSILMNFFFENLANGMSSEQALAKAKLDYLNDESISEKLKHPYYWAGVCHYGKGTSLPKESNAWKGIIGILIAVGAYVVIRFYGKRAAQRVAYNVIV